jgi:hypothetical protein
LNETRPRGCRHDVASQSINQGPQIKRGFERDDSDENGARAERGQCAQAECLNMPPCLSAPVLTTSPADEREGLSWMFMRIRFCRAYKAWPALVWNSYA